MAEINEYGEIIRDNNDKNTILQEVKEDINRICEEILEQQKNRTDINPEFAEYILKIFEDLKKEDVLLEDVLEKVNFVCSQIKEEYEKDINPKFGEYILERLNNLEEKIPPMPPKESPERKPWELSEKELSSINSQKALEDSSKATDEKELSDNIIE